MKKDSDKKNCDKACSMAIFAAVALVGVSQLLIKTHSDNFSNQVLQEENNRPSQRGALVPKIDFYPRGPSGVDPDDGGLFDGIFSLPFLWCSNKNDCILGKDSPGKCKWGYYEKDGMVINCSANSSIGIVPSMSKNLVPPGYELQQGDIPPGVKPQKFTGPVSFKCNNLNGKIGEWARGHNENGDKVTYWCTSGL